MKTVEQIVHACAQTPQDRMLIVQLLEKDVVCQQRAYMTYTRFLDLRERTLCMRVAQQAGITKHMIFWGGYEQAERVIAEFLPDYMDEQDAKTHSPLVLIRMEKNPADTLTHRDYLGALMGLGIDRTMLGDIVIQPDGAQLFVMQELAQFVCMNLLRVGKKRIQCTQIPLSEFQLPQVCEQMGEGTVASLRLDSVAALIFRTSRAQMQERIEKGLVFVNHMQCLDADTPVGIDDRITVRGEGRARIDALGGISKKGRQFVRYARSV